MMSKETVIHIRLFIAVVAVFMAVVGVSSVLKNCDAEVRCESLRKQGAKVYVSKGLLMKHCEVILRDVVQP
jgi:hypothetical protein